MLSDEQIDGLCDFLANTFTEKECADLSEEIVRRALRHQDFVIHCAHMAHYCTSKDLLEILIGRGYHYDKENDATIWGEGRQQD